MTATAQQAQSAISYDNLLKMWTLENGSKISQQVKQWGYKLLDRYKDEYEDELEYDGNVIWTNADCKWDNIEEEWYVPKNSPHTEIAGFFFKNKIIYLTWDFNDKKVYGSLKKQVKNANWYPIRNDVNNDELAMEYSSPINKSFNLYLKESKNGRYSISIFDKKHYENAQSIHTIMSEPDTIGGLLRADILGIIAPAGIPTFELEPKDKVFVYDDVAEQSPSFNGDLDAWIKSNLKYPKEAEENGIEGRPIVRFIVNEDGTITHAKVIRGVDDALDEEALRLVKNMPKWIPGKQNGKAVKCKYTVPVVFRLE